MLMGIPSTDYDIATDARPEEVMALFKKTIPVGAQFGVVKVLKDGFQFEVATFRSDSTYSDGRHPDEVAFTDAKGDVQRRDFTINGMLYDPASDNIIDYVGGKKDIEARLIRTIGDPYKRFEEDKLRLLRAVRFACRFDYEIEPETASAIKKYAPKILTVSAERIREELEKIITGPQRVAGLKLMDELGLLGEILPEVTAMKGVEQPPNFHPEGDVYVHSLLTLSKLEDNPTWTLAMGTLLHDIGKPVTFIIKERIRFPYHEYRGEEMAGKICDRLKTSKAEKEQVMWLIRRHLCFKDARKMKISTLKKLFAHEGYAELAALFKADVLSSTCDLDDYNFCQEMYEKLSHEEVKPKPLINGHDLIAMGLTPGPIFSKVLTQVYEEQLEEKITTREEALAMAEKLSRQ
jgi:poly(A) polymerase